MHRIEIGFNEAQRRLWSKETRQRYWDRRYRLGGAIYGSEPSLAARLACDWVLADDSVVELGGGYGRNARAFEGRCRRYTVIDSSPFALEHLAPLFGSAPPGWLTLTCGDLLLVPWAVPTVVFSNFVLHLFLREEREQIMSKASHELPEGGLFINAFLTNGGKILNVGPEIEPGTHLKEGGGPWHVFEESEVRNLLAQNGFEVLLLERRVEEELISGTIEETPFLFAVARLRTSQSGRQPR